MGRQSHVLESLTERSSSGQNLVETMVTDPLDGLTEKRTPEVRETSETPFPALASTTRRVAALADFPSQAATPVIAMLFTSSADVAARMFIRSKDAVRLRPPDDRQLAAGERHLSTTPSRQTRG